MGTRAPGGKLGDETPVPFLRAVKVTITQENDEQSLPNLIRHGFPRPAKLREIPARVA
jgi:hypothetical protein